MPNIFTQHPHSVNETYLEHLKFAFSFGMNMLMGGLACMIHAIFPFLFQQTGSNLLLRLMQRLIDRTPVIEERVIILSKLIKKKLRIQNGFI